MPPMSPVRSAAPHKRTPNTAPISLRWASHAAKRSHALPLALPLVIADGAGPAISAPPGFHRRMAVIGRSHHG